MSINKTAENQNSNIVEEKTTSPLPSNNVEPDENFNKYYNSADFLTEDELQGQSTITELEDTTENGTEQEFYENTQQHAIEEELFLEEKNDLGDESYDDQDFVSYHINPNQSHISDGMGWNEYNFNEEFKENSKTIFLGEPKTKTTGLFAILTIVVGIYFVLSSFFLNVLLTPLLVEGASMYPTINQNALENDVVYIKRTQDVTNGDMVIINALAYTHEEAYYIKRVVAVAGQTVEFVKVAEEDGSYKTYKDFDNENYSCKKYRLKVDGELLEEDYINHEIKDNPNTMLLRQETTSEFYINYVKGGKVFTVPENSVFILGDNRRVSNDSKYFGAVQLKDIVGKVAILQEHNENIFVALANSIKEGYLF